MPPIHVRDETTDIDSADGFSFSESDSDDEPPAAAAPSAGGAKRHGEPTSTVGDSRLGSEPPTVPENSISGAGGYIDMEGPPASENIVTGAVVNSACTTMAEAAPVVTLQGMDGLMETDVDAVTDANAQMTVKLPKSRKDTDPEGSKKKEENDGTEHERTRVRS
jgi:hypothetical protein